jgi:hypothetical protein
MSAAFTGSAFFGVFDRVLETRSGWFVVLTRVRDPGLVYVLSFPCEVFIESPRAEMAQE